MKNRILLLSALAILLTGCSLGPTTTNTSSVSPQDETTPTSSSSVIYSDNGFSPSTLTIKSGTTVTFTNQSSGSMWVASNPHPTHTDLPEFDEKLSSENGGIYSYTFTKVGTWGYHNHKNPSQGGTIIVTD